MNKKNKNTRIITALALLVAMEIVLSRFLSISCWNLKIGFSFLPVAVAAVVFGPLAAGLSAALADFLGAVLFPIAAYFPGFTLTAFLRGLSFGLIYKKPSVASCVISVLINQLCLSLILNSLWISVLYGTPFIAILLTRTLQCAVMLPIELIVLLLLRRFIPALRRAAGISSSDNPAL